MVADTLSHLPLASAVVWSFIGALQVRGGTHRVSTGAAFTATAFLLAGTALWDWLTLVFALPQLLPGPLPPSRFYLVSASLTFLYFAKWLVHGRRWYDAIVALPAIVFLLPFVLPHVPYLQDLWTASEPFPLLARQALERADPEAVDLSVVSMLYVVGLILAGVQFLRQGALLALDALGRESWGILAIMGAALLLVAFALLTNPYVPVLQEGVPLSIFSATLVVPGALLLSHLRREERLGVLQLFNLKQAFKGETLAVYLIYRTGDLLGAALGEGERMDDDVFVGTLDAFQSFFTHALPFLRGHPLRTATFGEIAVIIERGDHCYLTVVTTSKRLGLIKELMRRRLRRFEEENAAVLADWSGMVDVLRGTDQILQGFVPEEEAEEVVVAASEPPTPVAAFEAREEETLSEDSSPDEAPPDEDEDWPL